MKRAEGRLRDLWDNIKHTNIRFIGVPEKEEKKKGYEAIFEEIIVENFANMEKEVINSRISEAEERISELEDKMVEITSEEQNKVKRMKRAEGRLRDLWDNIKHTNIRFIGVPEK